MQQFVNLTQQSPSNKFHFYHLKVFFFLYKSAIQMLMRSNEIKSRRSWANWILK
jgi:hypothetical protein